MNDVYYVMSHGHIGICILYHAQCDVNADVVMDCVIQSQLRERERERERGGGIKYKEIKEIRKWDIGGFSAGHRHATLHYREWDSHVGVIMASACSIVT